MVRASVAVAPPQGVNRSAPLYSRGGYCVRVQAEAGAAVQILPRVSGEVAPLDLVDALALASFSRGQGNLRAVVWPWTGQSR